MPEGYGSHRDYMSRVAPGANARQEAIEEALRAAFAEFIETREVEVILFSNIGVLDLASAISQTYDRVEIIAVDDGSTDDTRRILESYGERVRVVRSEHRGAAAARNIGAEAAQGDLLQFLDADDVLDERKLAVQLRGLGSHDGVIRYCDEITVDAGDGRILRRYSPDLEGDDPVPMLITRLHRLASSTVRWAAICWACAVCGWPSS